MHRLKTGRITIVPHTREILLFLLRLYCHVHIIEDKLGNYSFSGKY
jgi:hypothetical protein